MESRWIGFVCKAIQEGGGVFSEAGFTSIEFRPFELPIDLPFPAYDAAVVTFTRKDELGGWHFVEQSCSHGALRWLASRELAAKMKLDAGPFCFAIVQDFSNGVSE